MATNVALKLKVDQIDGLAKRLGELDGALAGEVIVQTINETLDEAYDFADKRIRNGINLTQPYVQRKMTKRAATEQKPEAAITAEGTATALSHYDKQQAHVPVNWSNAKITGMGKKFGKWPGWTQRRGGLEIPVDRKAAGQSVAVRSGGRADFKSAFSVPGKKDNEGNFLMFSRNPATDKLRVLYGPAVYQLFKYQLIKGGFAEETQALMGKNLDDRIEKELQRVELK